MIPNIGQAFKPDEFADVLQEACVNSVTVFAKCHHGMSYHPTKVGVMHPHLKFDLLGQMIDACHKAGIRVPVYISVMWDEYIAEKQPGWRVLTEDGKPDGAGPLEAGWRRLCLNTPYLDYLAAQTEEVVKTYDVDGIFFDIMRYQGFGCFCPFCVREREKLGLDSTRSEDRMKHAQMVIAHGMERLDAVVRKHKPKASLFYNGRIRVGLRPELKHFTHLEIESLPGGRWSYTHFQVMSRYVRNLGFDYMGMTGRFHRSWGDFGSIRNQAALDYECFAMLAQGAKCSVGDQLHPSGNLNRTVFERIGRTYRSVAEKEPWCAGAKAVTEIGFLSTADFAVPGMLSDSDQGVTRMLAQQHYQFDTLDRESDFQKYKLLILPDSHRLDARLLERLQAYLAGGGKLLLSHESGLDAEGKRFALPGIGLDYEGPAKDKIEYIEVLEGLNAGLALMVHVLYEQGSAVKAQPGTTVHARIWRSYFDRDYRHFSSHRQTPAEKPTDYAAVAERGNIIYIAAPIFRAYMQHSYQFDKQLVGNCITRLLPTPLIRAAAPSTAQITLTEQPSRRIVHLLHYVAERRTPDIDIVEDVIPLANVKLSVRMDHRPKLVYLAPQRQRVKFNYANGYVSLTVAGVNGHQMVVLEG